MKSFLLLTGGGALGAACIALASGAAADHFLASWKVGQSSTLTAVAGFSLAAVNQILVLPAKILSFGSQSSAVLIVATAICFALWGFVFAAVWRRMFRTKRAGT